VNKAYAAFRANTSQDMGELSVESHRVRRIVQRRILFDYTNTVDDYVRLDTVEQRAE